MLAALSGRYVEQPFRKKGGTRARNKLFVGSAAVMALTTAFGLAIAMPSLIAYKYFQAKVAKLRCELEANCTELEMALGISVSRPS